MKRTEHYDLPTWEMTDRVLMSDFNDMTGKIDGALGTLSDSIYIGSYAGDGSSERIVELPWTPRFVILMGSYGHGDALVRQISIVTKDFAYAARGNARSVENLRLVERGIHITDAWEHNVSDYEQHYIAVR